LSFPASRGVQRLGRLAGQVEELEDHADPLPRDGDRAAGRPVTVDQVQQRYQLP
jgi:hypothetical protein